MCRVGALNGAAYEWAHHHPLMVKAGVSEEGAETVRTAARGEGGEGGGLSKELWVLLRFCDAVTDMKVDDAIFQEMKDVCGGDEKTVLELSMSFAPGTHREEYVLTEVLSYDDYFVQCCVPLSQGVGCARDATRRSGKGCH